MSARTIEAVIAENETLKTQVTALTAERDKFKADAEAAKAAEATAKTDATTAKADAEKLKTEAATAKADIEKLKADAEKSKLEAKALDEKVAARIKELGISNPQAAAPASQPAKKKSMTEECVDWRKANNLPVPAIA
jgi:chromosome segregation ATPase